MYPDTPARVCTTCPVLHLENCELCWGFGITRFDHPDGPIPCRGI